MNDTCKATIYRGYWLGEEEHTILKESYPWPEVGDLSNCQCNVSVGPPYDEPEYYFEWTSQLYSRMNKLRIDFVARSGSKWILTEVTPSIGAGSTGKTELYKKWYSRDFGVAEESIQVVLLGREFNQSIPPMCEELGIWLGVVEEGGELEWIKKE